MTLYLIERANAHLILDHCLLFCITLYYLYYVYFTYSTYDFFKKILSVIHPLMRLDSQQIPLTFKYSKNYYSTSTLLQLGIDH